MSVHAFARTHTHTHTPIHSSSLLPNNKHDHYWSYPNPNLTIPQPRNTVPILKFKNLFMGIEFCPHNADKSPQCVCKHIFVLTM